MKKLLSIVLATIMLTSCSVPKTASPEEKPVETSKETSSITENTTSSNEIKNNDAGKPQKLVFADISEVISLDPHVGNDFVTSTGILMVNDGLLNLKNGEIVPGLAEKFDISEDGTVYTFHLRDAKWSDGKPVLAQDFYDSYARMLTRQDAMDLAYLLFPIKNSQPISEGAKDLSELGVKVIDEKTLEVTLEGPLPFIQSLFASTPFFPLRMDLVDKYGNAYGNAADKTPSCGPFILKEWSRGDRLVFVKNPDYWDADSIKLEEVTMLYISDPNTVKNMYDAGEIDFFKVGQPDIVSAYKDDKNLGYISGGVHFIVLSQKGTSEEQAKILQNRNFLMALSSSIDREAFVKAMYPTDMAFTGVINPYISDAMGGKWGDKHDVQDKYHKLQADPKLAKEYIEKACQELGYSSPSDMPVFDLMNLEGELNRTVSEYLQNAWETTLGIKTEVRQLAMAQYYENLYSAPYDIARTGWGPDYDDPFTYLDMWDSRGGWNKTGWEGKNFYETTGEANKQQDFNKRNLLFAKAEEILLTEAPIIPLKAGRSAYLVNKDKIDNISINMLGPTFDFRYATIK